MASPVGPSTPRVSYPMGVRPRRKRGLRDEVEQPVVHDPHPPVVRQLFRQLPEPGMAHRVLGEDVLLDARALAALGRRAQHRARRARPPAHHAEAVADRHQRRLVAGPDAVVQREQRTFPGGIFLDALGPRRRRRRSGGGRCVPARRCRCTRRIVRPAASGIMWRRRTSYEIGRMRSPVSASTPARSQAASFTTCTSESWPMFGQPWFMSRMATSIAPGSAGGTSSGRSDAHVLVDRRYRARDTRRDKNPCRARVSARRCSGGG